MWIVEYPNGGIALMKDLSDYSMSDMHRQNLRRLKTGCTYTMPCAMDDRGPRVTRLADTIIVPGQAMSHRAEDVRKVIRSLVSLLRSHDGPMYTPMAATRTATIITA